MSTFQNMKNHTTVKTINLYVNQYQNYTSGIGLVSCCTCIGTDISQLERARISTILSFLSLYVTMSTSQCLINTFDFDEYQESAFPLVT